GRPIVSKDTVLNEIEIEFIQKFLVENVDVSINKKQETHKQEKITLHKEEIVQEIDPFQKLYGEVSQQFKKLFASWQANLPVKMFQVREIFLPLFDLVERKNLSEIKSLLDGR